MPECDEVPDQDQILERAPLQLENIFVRGNERTKTEFVRAEFEKAREAETFLEQYEALEDSVESLRSLDVFSSVVANMQPGSSPDKLDVHVLLREASSWPPLFSIGGEFKDNAVSVTSSLKLRNLFGRAESLQVQVAKANLQSHIFDASLAVPRAFSRRARVYGSVFRRQLDRSDISSLVCSALGAQASVSDQSGRNKLTYEFSWRDNFANHPNSPPTDYVGPSESIISETITPSAKSSISYTHVKDTRDHIFLPNSGQLLRLCTEVSGLGGDVRFLKATADASLFLPINPFKDVSLGLFLQGGFMRPWSFGGREKRTHINDRLFLGGPNSVRGFALGQIGPRDGHDSLGGDTLLAAGAALTFPLRFLFGRFVDWDVRGQVFATAGNVSALSQSSKPTFAALSSTVLQSRMSAGCGLVIPSAFGRIEFNVCAPMRAQAGEETARFQVNIGTNFM
eukprot:83233_1